jgi:hypothetical protein
MMKLNIKIKHLFFFNLSICSNLNLWILKIAKAQCFKIEAQKTIPTYKSNNFTDRVVLRL